MRGRSLLAAPCSPLLGGADPFPHGDDGNRLGLFFQFPEDAQAASVAPEAQDGIQLVRIEALDRVAKRRFGS